jgi:hypothetical protein
MVIDDFKGADGLWVGSIQINGKQVRTKSCNVWQNIRKRCKVGGYVQKFHPTYIGCCYSEDFSDFQLFTGWHVSQVGYGLENYNLDKDVLVQGNKLYCSEMCVVIPRQLNTFFCSAEAIRGEYPQGVHKEKVGFVAQIRISGTLNYLGYFKTPEEASAAYKVAKEAEAYRWYERLRDGEFIVDPRVIERMRTWTFEESV